MMQRLATLAACLTIGSAPAAFAQTSQPASGTAPAAVTPSAPAAATPPAAPVATPPPPAAAPVGGAPLSVPEAVSAARAQFENREYELARLTVTGAIERDPSNIDALLLDAEIAELEADIERARKRYLAVLQIRPEEFEANLALGRMYDRSKVYRLSLNYLTTAEKVSANAPAKKRGELYVLLGRARRGSGDPEGALQAAVLATQADPDNLDAWAYVMELMVMRRDWGNARVASINMVGRARIEVERDPGNAQAYTQLYRAYASAIDVLRRYYQTLFIMNPDGTVSERIIPGNETQAAEVLAEIGSLNVVQIELATTIGQLEVAALLKPGLAYSPDHPALLVQLGLLYRLTGQVDQARATFEHLLAVQPDHETARRELSLLAGRPAASQPQPVPPGFAPTPEEDLELKLPAAPASAPACTPS